jgi:AcrR family transcriptional regulator
MWRRARGLAKGTVFLYFKTEEALFLALVEQRLVEWFAERLAQSSHQEEAA